MADQNRALLIGTYVFALVVAAYGARADGTQPAGQPAAGAANEDEAFLQGPKDADRPGTAETTGADASGQTGTSAGNESEKGERPRDHAMQGFVNVLVGTGWFMVAPKDKNDPDRACSELERNEEGKLEGEPICTGLSAVHMDFLGGFGVLPGFEVFAIFRLGLWRQDELAAPLNRQIGAGVKLYTPADGLFKMGFGAAPLFDFSDRHADIGYDFVLHVPIVAQFDFLPWLGAYLQVAANVSFITEFRLDITGGAGIQGRFP